LKLFSSFRRRDVGELLTQIYEVSTPLEARAGVRLNIGNRQTVRHFGGFVAKYLVDGVLVYFGYPQAHEDDAERAVRAGLESIQAVDALKSGAPLQTPSALPPDWLWSVTSSDWERRRGTASSERRRHLQRVCRQ